jgi:integrase
MAVIYKIMTETAVEETELELTPRNQINTNTGTISIIGTKKHDNGTYKLKDQTKEMLNQYLATHTEEYPFPKAKSMRGAWIKSRKRTAKKLCNQELNKIPLKNLRNYAGAIYYLTMGKDPIATMHFMRHKELPTTMHYLKGLTEFTANAEYISKIATTAEEAIELLNQGFKEQSIFGEKHIYTKLKY